MRILNTSSPIDRGHPVNRGLIGCYAQLPSSYTPARIRDQFNRNDMALGSGTTLSMLGPTTRSVSFSSGSATIPSTIWRKVNTVGKVSLGLWIYPTTLGSYRSVVDTASRQFSFFINSVNDGFLGMGGADGGVSFSIPFTTDEWQYIVITYDAADCKVYRNGVFVGNHTFTATAFTENLVFGANPSGGGSNYAGKQAGWRLWGKALTARQVRAAYKEAKKGFFNTYRYLDDPTFTTISNDMAMVADTGYFTLDGQAATLTFHSAGEFSLSADYGDFSIGGQAATLTFTPVATYSLTADYGPFVLSGQTALLRSGTSISDPTQESLLGRYRRGVKLPISIVPSSLTDACPTVEFWHEGTTLVKTVQLPVTSRSVPVFSVKVFLGSEFVDGHYVAVISYQIDNKLSRHYQYFEVIGGQATGFVVGLQELRRPLGRAIVSQRDDGTVAMAYNPRTE